MATGLGITSCSQQPPHYHLTDMCSQPGALACDCEKCKDSTDLLNSESSPIPVTAMMHDMAVESPLESPVESEEGGHDVTPASPIDYTVDSYDHPPLSLALQDVVVDPETETVHHVNCRQVDLSWDISSPLPVEEFILRNKCQCIPYKYSFLSLKLSPPQVDIETHIRQYKAVLFNYVVHQLDVAKQQMEAKICKK